MSSQLKFAYFLLFFLSFESTAVIGQKGVPILEVDEYSYNFGTINEGDIVKHIFTFKNIGDAPLIISRVIGACGCIRVDWNEKPILPGEKGAFTVVFNSKIKKGFRNEKVTILSNLSSSHIYFYLNGKVIPKEKALVEEEGVTVEDKLEIELYDYIYNIGSINEGDKVIHEFTFKNIGNKPLIIQEVKSKFGVKVLSWPQKLILPGEKSSIIAEYFFGNRKGFINSKITLVYNLDQTYFYFIGDVIFKSDVQNSLLKKYD